MIPSRPIDTFPSEALTQQLRAKRVLRWLTWAVGAVLLAQIVSLFVLRDSVIVITTVLAACCWITVIGARWLAYRGALRPAAALITSVFLGCIMLANLLTPLPLVALLLPTMCVAVIAISLTQGRMLDIALSMCLAASFFLTITMRSADIPLQRDGVPYDNRLLTTSVLVLLSLIYGLLWAFHRRLIATLADLEQANIALQGMRKVLAAENEWLTVTLDSIGDAVVVVDTNTRISLMNEAATALVGIGQAESIGQSFERIVQLRDQHNQLLATNPIQTVLAYHRPLVFGEQQNIAITARDGVRRTITARMSPVTNRSQITVGVVIVLSDITAQRQAQQALNHSEQLFAKVFRSSLIGIALLTLENGDFVDANEHLLALIGFERHDILGRSLASLDILLEQAKIKRVQIRLRRHRALRNIIVGYRSKTGTLREAMISLEVFDVEAEAYVILMAQDITEQRMTEDALHESESLYRLITENTHDLIAILDDQQRYFYLSPSHQHVLGDHISHLLGRSLFDIVHPDDQASLRQHWRDLVEHDQQLASVRFRCADSTWHWFELQATAITEADTQAVVLVARDTTQRRNLEAQFHQSQKMESMGRLAGGVAHDFNNMLSAIAGYTELVIEDMTVNSPAWLDMIEIQRATNRASGLARQLLTLARKQVVEAQPVDLNELILDIVKLLRRLLREDIELVTLPTNEPCVAKVDSSQIEQVLINLAVNAGDAMPTGGKLVIETSNVVLGDTYVASHIGVIRGTYVQVTVSDTGVGMSSEVKRQAFEPFFTTKPRGKGTGLGLATCYSIVTQHGGTINLYSEQNHGTAFKIYLPAIAANATVPRVAETSKPQGGNETILLAEDEALVRELAARVLRAQGYTVLVAANGEEALRVAESYTDGPIHMLLTDLVMPQMSGTMLAERLRLLLPAIRLLFMSGYSGTTATHHGQIIATSAFIQKPFSIVLLATKVREVLDETT